MSQLVVTDLHKSFGATRVLQGVDLEVERGDLTVLLGASGSGKSTILRLAAGFERVDRGRICIGPTTVATEQIHIAPEHRHIGYVAQDGALFPHLDVLANIGFGLRRNRRKSSRVRELIDIVGLEGLEARYPQQLSGGQQRRVALARALAVEPALLLLDEPFSALDAALRATVRDEVVEIVRRAGTTTLLVTHDQIEALSIADTVAVLRDGRVAQHARPSDLYRTPLDPELAAFLGPANFVDGTTEAGAAVTPFGRIALHPSAREAAGANALTVLLRPEQIAISTDTARTGVTGHVVTSTYHGPDTLVTVQPDTGTGITTAILARADDPLAPATCVVLTAHGSAMAWSRHDPAIRG
jgi:iron(III) transport system ATP-binding protein